MTLPAAMRHFTNIGLLLCFCTLAVTGVMAYALPFDISTTRVHMVFGLSTMILVGLHLGTRLAYFKKQLFQRHTGQGRISRPVLAGIFGIWLLLLAAALHNGPPARQITAQSYEARQRAAIVRPVLESGFADLSGRERLVVRKAPKGASVTPISLYLRFGPKLPEPPALAIWAETPSGSMIETLFLDPKLAYSQKPDWGGAPLPRHHILPIWRHRFTLFSGVEPGGAIDGFTAATPNHSFSLDRYLQLGTAKEFVLMVEVNAAGDVNDSFSDPHIGQPSLVYAAHIRLNQDSPYTLLELTGHGGGAEQNGALNYDLDGFSSARELMDLLLVRIGESPELDK